MRLARLLSIRLAGPAWALAAEAAWHLLGAAWAFAVLAAAIGWLAARLPAAMAGAAAATAKAAAVENRVDALVPAVNDAKDAAAAAQSSANTAQSAASTAQNTANTALNTIPDNHSFLSGLSALWAQSVSTGPDVGALPTRTCYYEADAPASYTQGTQQAYVNHHNFIVDDLTHLWSYIYWFADTYNQTQWCLQYIQGQLSAHGYSAN